MAAGPSHRKLNADWRPTGVRGWKTEKGSEKARDRGSKRKEEEKWEENGANEIKSFENQSRKKCDDGQERKEGMKQKS